MTPTTSQSLPLAGHICQLRLGTTQQLAGTPASQSVIVSAKTHSQVESATTSLSHSQGQEDTLSESSKSPVGLANTDDIPKSTNDLIGKRIEWLYSIEGICMYYCRSADHTRSVVFTCLTSPVENW